MLPRYSALLTDLYQFTMLQGYLEQGMEEVAVYEFFVRKLPPGRNFLLAAGLEQALQFLETVAFSTEEVAWLEQTGRFSPKLLDYVANFRFSGDVDAMAEGTVFFTDEPILRVVAPIPVAQLVETRLINLLHFQTLVASKAARVVLAAPGKLLVDFGLRRAHGAEAGLLAARACYLAGFGGSSNVLAEREFGIPSYGTMAHSFVQAHADEAQAFANFAHAQPGNVVLLIDTYDTEAAAHKVVALALRLAQDGIRIKAVRLDSGDLGEHARKVRAILDRGGLRETGIFASGNLDEFELARLAAQQSPISGFGVGTRLLTSSDAPYLDCAYKLQEYAGRPRRKRSEGKATWPGRKQVFRSYGPDGRMVGDILALEQDRHPGEALLKPVMRGGKRLTPAASLAEARALAAAELARLPEGLRQLDKAAPYSMEVAQSLQDLARTLDRQHG
ncbi:MAG: nicotinate phosphoribosyltransferase [Sulfurimicrobium sp.]|nr:nicotinate phosphoribosyltransferase [Sulfurimicrobium sp.]MDP1706018.1 nicotinate phosphoribosyltransferase [Sulfurimicrobium sp.]MDP2197778.1 nicotinate phosphoribosyltransferase [Sulfurimicrobium sp.]